MRVRATKVFAILEVSNRMTAYVDDLLLCWNFIMSSPEPQPIEKLMMKITTKAHLYSSARTKDDSERNDENMFVCQHSSKPNVTCRAFLWPLQILS
jgi:hypothetical protein